MSNETPSIHDFDFSLIAEYYAGLDRQGPGSPEATAKAASFVRGLNSESLVADIGCGSGTQTMFLARNIPGQITGIDLFPRFIDLLNQQAVKLGLEDRVKGKVGSMDALDFKEGSLDLMWSEGAIYFLGFEEGLKLWRKFLKPGAYVAVSEATWFTLERPAEIEDFWQDAYPGIDTMPRKLAQMQRAGYDPVACFRLPEDGWIEHFYEPQVEAEKAFLKKHAGNNAAEDFIANQRYEAQLYGKYKEHYGYAFYIGRKA